MNSDASSSSEDEEELRRLQGVAVSGQDVAAAAAAAPARKGNQRKAFGGQRTDDGGDGKHSIVEEKLWRALASRLDVDLDSQPDSQLASQSESSDGGNGTAEGGTDSIRLFRRVEAGQPIELREPSSNGLEGEGEDLQLTKRERRRLENAARRKEQKCRKQEAETPAKGPIDKVAKALEAAGEVAHFLGDSTSTAAANSGPQQPLTPKEKQRLKRIRKKQDRWKAKELAVANLKIEKAEHHRRKHHYKELKQKRNAKAAAKQAAAEGEAAAAVKSGSDVASKPASRPKRQTSSVRRGKFSKAKVKKQAKAKKATKPARSKSRFTN